VAFSKANERVSVFAAYLAFLRRAAIISLIPLFASCLSDPTSRDQLSAEATRGFFGFATRRAILTVSLSIRSLIRPESANQTGEPIAARSVFECEEE
jgi:hypothetical protein